MRVAKIFALIGWMLPALVFANAEEMSLQSVKINLQDKASLQRGARTFMNYCSGCHSAKYMRYSRMAQDIGIVNDKGVADEKLVKENLIFTGDKFHDTIQNAMSAEHGKQWFGVAPPDLSLVARSRGADWIYTYLLNFYEDPKQPSGSNNRLFPSVAMPNILGGLQGKQVPHYTAGAEHAEKPVIEYLTLQESGTMDSLQFRGMVADLVNFLVYVGEPAQLERQAIGPWVLLFLAIFIVLAYALKREYWRDVH